MEQLEKWEGQKRFFSSSKTTIFYFFTTFFLSQIDPNALIGDKLKAMSDAIAAGKPLPEIDHDDIGIPIPIPIPIPITIHIPIPISIYSIFGNDYIGQVFFGNDDIGVGKCIVEFEKQGTAVMEDVGTFLVKILRLGDTSSQVTIYWK